MLDDLEGGGGDVRRNLDGTGRTCLDHQTVPQWRTFYDGVNVVDGGSDG